MIPLTRRSTLRKLETALLSCSRQSLPRPARLYSTPTKRNEAPALATATLPSSNDLQPLVSTSQTFGASASGHASDFSEFSDSLQTFLRRRLPYTMLPSPLPSDTSSAKNDYYYPDSPTQDSLSVIDACLHGCYDVPRANFVFKQIRRSRQAEAVLRPPLYNLFLETYLEMALEKDVANRRSWLEDAWKLYDIMESGREKVVPIASTYAIMLKIYTNSASLDGKLSAPSERSPSDLLRFIINRDIAVATIVGDRSLSSKEAALIVQHLSRSAVELRLPHVISELGQVENIATDPLKDVPEVMPASRNRTGYNIPLLSEGLSKADLDQIEKKVGKAEEPSADTPFNISNLRRHLAEVAYAQRVLPDDVAARQKLLEASVYDLAVQRLRHEADKLAEVGLNSQKLQAAQLQTWMFDWHEKLQKRIASEVEMLSVEEMTLTPNVRDNTQRMRLGPYLSLLKPEKLSLITILELMRLQGTGGIAEGMKTARALLQVGKAVEMEHKAEVLKKNNIAIPQVAHRPNDMGYFTRRAYEELRMWRMSAANFTEVGSEWTSEWTHAVRARVGSCLVDCLMEVATVKRTAIDKRTGEEVVEEHPAFYHSYEYLRGHKLGVIRLNPTVAERLAKDDIKSTLHPRHLPMLIRPKPWVNHEEGGYIFNKNSVMRLKDTQEQLTYLRHASSAGHMEHVFAGLDVLGSTPWKINRNIFDIVLEVWNSGENFCKIPAATYSVPEPAKPENYDHDVLAKSHYLQAWKQWQLDKANNHSNRCSVNYKVEIARAFLADTFYLPHNIDFRGRAYPIPPHLSHIGDDLSRGLMKFADAKPLGSSGLRWLKIHLSNLYGFDKGSFDERVQFVHDHLDDIHDSAKQPLEGRRWWIKADDPWQCLSACMELHNALESGDPEGFNSDLPVHQDGTCNGLQHYAALGGDIKGAQQVNLDITDRPADVYTHVADMVEKIIEKDAVEKDHKYAKMLQGKVSRKVVKQTVMTTVYGVTYIGARDQIERQLRGRGDIPAEETWSAAAYLARNVISCIGDLFTAAKSIQNWLTFSARLIAKSIPRERVEAAVQELEVKSRKKGDDSKFRSVMRLPKEQMTSVVWTTPLGLPIVQPYRKTKRKQIMTSIQTVFISDPNVPTEVNAAKQATAFPPNFIHSLDATHMMLTALECSKHGLTFASVHDSYWTHAATIEKMNVIIRDTFIALHESNVLERLHKEFMDRYKNYQVSIVSLQNKTLLEKLTLPAHAVPVLTDTPEAAAEFDAIAGEEITLDVDLTKNDINSIDEPVVNDIPEPETEFYSTKTVPSRDGKLQMTTYRLNEMADELAISNAKSQRSRKSLVGRAQITSRFVNLIDLIPPLPKKGNFDVQKIKQSEYFFS